jgi:hypothetical protein
MLTAVEAPDPARPVRRTAARHGAVCSLICAVIALSACGGGGSDEGATSAGSSAGASGPAPGPVAAPGPTPSAGPTTDPAPSGTVVKNTRLCGKVLSGPRTFEENCAENGPFRYNGSAFTEICLSPTCPTTPPTPLSFQFSIDTDASYLRSLSARFVVCQVNPTRNLDTDANCPESTRNDGATYGRLGFRFDPPNGPVGPRTSVTVQLLSSTFQDDASCTILGAPSPFSDVTHLRVQDEDGNRLYMPVRILGRSCVRAS